MARTGTSDSGATFTIEKHTSRRVTTSRRAYIPPSAEPTNDATEPTTLEPTPRPTPASADTPARGSYLLPGDLDTDSEEELTAEKIIQREAQRTKKNGAVQAAAQQTSETERPPERSTTSRWQAPSVLGVFGSQIPTRAPLESIESNHYLAHSYQIHQKDP